MATLKPKPFLKPAMEALQGQLQTMLRESFDKMAAEMLTSTKAMTPSGGHVIPRSIRMAHPAEPWPYGTVLRHPSGRKAMFIGRDTAFDNRFLGMDVIHGHPFSFNDDDWEPVPEPDL